MPQIDIHLFINHIIALYLLFFFIYWNIKSNNFMQISLVIKTRKLLKEYLIFRKNIAIAESFYLKALFIFLLKKKVINS